MNTWLPIWVGAVGTMVFVVIAAVHVWHVVVMTGRPRWWHGGHVLMALGMIVMFAPTDHLLVSSGVGQIVFALAALAVVALLVADLAWGRAVGRLWLVTVADLVVMIYMFATSRLVWLTVAFAAWLVLQAAGWATGWLYAALHHGGLGIPEPQLAGALRKTAVARRPSTDSPGNQSKLAAATYRHDTYTFAHRAVIRATLTLMALGMAYMLLAMQFGMGAMGQHPGMPGM